VPHMLEQGTAAVKIGQCWSHRVASAMGSISAYGSGLGPKYRLRPGRVSRR
jgi:hypothetical protein